MSGDNNHKKSLRSHIRKEVRGGILLNAAINGIGGYWAFRHVEEVTFWGEGHVVSDFLLSCFAIGWLLMAYFAWRFRKTRDSWDDSASAGFLHRLAARLPHGNGRASLYVGLAILLMSAVLLVPVAAVSQFFALTPIHYGALKGLWVALLVAAVVQVGIWQGLKSQGGMQLSKAA